MNKAYEQFVLDHFKAMPDSAQTFLHAAVGIAGEAGEIIDAVKKYWVYNKPLDKDNLREELGDILFYIQAMATLLETDIQALTEANIAKLMKRYPAGGYSDHHAQARLDKETK